MGTICSSQPAISGNDGGVTKKSIHANSYADAEDVASMLKKADGKEKSLLQSMLSVQKSIMKILKSDVSNEIIVLTIPTRHFFDFIANLEAMLTLMHHET